MGAHFYCITICGLAGRKTVWPGEPIEHEKGGGGVVGRASSQIFCINGRIIRQVSRNSGPVIRWASYRWTIYYTNHGLHCFIFIVGRLVGVAVLNSHESWAIKWTHNHHNNTLCSVLHGFRNHQSVIQYSGPLSKTPQDIKCI
jgi:hypothetical protein